MFSPEVIARREADLIDALGDLLPGGTLIRHSLDHCWAMRDQLADARSPKNEPLRDLTKAEEAFIFHERLLCKLDYRYFSERYAVVAKETGDAEPLTPRWASQELFLKHLGNLELSRFQSGHPDGLLLNVLKARQLGISTEVEVILAHRLLTQTTLKGLVAGDVPEQSKYLFSMAELVVEETPWWLKPEITAHQTGSFLQLATGTTLRSAAGKSQRGGLQDKGGTKGNLGRGKSQPLTAKILTPTGWTTMGAIKPGDFVIGADGRPTEVLAIHPQGTLPIFRVEFTDGSSTECCDEHLWAVRSSQGNQLGFASHVLPLSKLRTTLTWKGTRRRFIPLTKPVAFASSPADLPLDAYFVGALLGDGGLTQACMFSTADAEMLSFLRAAIPASWTITHRSKYDWSINAPLVRNRSPLRAALKRLNLFGKRGYEKRIPPVYLCASIAERQRLLQGLIDTDGWVAADRIEFGTSSLGLAEDMTFLVESLGGVARCRSKIPTCRGKLGRRAYTLAIRLPKEIVPCRLSRKLAKLNPARKYGPTRGMVRIVPVGEAEAQCISVAAADGLYLTDRCIVTHNTYQCVHISEVSTWERPDQLYDGLLPGIPRRSRSFCAFESTAKGRNNEWHQHWINTGKGLTRFVNVFIPWYIEPDKYWAPPPDGWEPSPEAKAHAAAVERDSPQWCFGQTIRLSKEKLFWWEAERAGMDARDMLAKFKEEYCATDLEAFQHAGSSVFSARTLDRLVAHAKPPLGIFHVKPSMDLALLKQHEREGVGR